jgi:Cys-rich protein (TIGR01571 family)
MSNVPVVSGTHVMPTATATPAMPIAVATATPMPVATAVATPPPVAIATAVAVPTMPAGGVYAPAGGNGRHAPSGYEQWPSLCDCFSAGNSMCLYGAFCMPCLAGHMYTHVLKRPGCCMQLSAVYTILGIIAGAFMLLGSLPQWMDRGRDDENGGDEEEGGGLTSLSRVADPIGRLLQAVATMCICYTLIRVRQELRNRSGGRLGGSGCEDCLCSYFCTCCTAIQMARYLGWEDRPYSVCSATGIDDQVPV